jgi:hypothetical protein
VGCIKTLKEPIQSVFQPFKTIFLRIIVELGANNTRSNPDNQVFFSPFGGVAHHEKLCFHKSGLFTVSRE